MLPDDDAIDWIFDATGWWLESFGGMASLAETPLAMPTPEHFPIDARQGPDQLAAQYLGCVQALSGTASWDLEVDLHQGPNVAEVLRGLPHGMTSAPTGGVRGGALSEIDLAYALALFVLLIEAPDRPVRKALRSNPSAFFKAAHKHIRRKRKDDVAKLRRIAQGGDGPYR